MLKPLILSGICFLCSAIASAGAAVQINETFAENSNRQLRWDASDQPFAGAGLPWWSPRIDDGFWREGEMPIGHSEDWVATELEPELLQQFHGVRTGD